MTEDNFTVRKASPADLPRIHGIYAAARQFMRDHGNFSQWDGEDAPEHLLPGDIEAGNLYVLEENGVIHAAFAFIIGADPCYAVIEQGAWKVDTPYAAVHRVASDGTVHNILGRIMDFAKSKISHIRIDTHENNKVMQRALENRDLRDAELSMSRTERRGSRLSGAGNHDADERHRIDHLVFEVSFLYKQLLTI